MHFPPEIVHVCMKLSFSTGEGPAKPWPLQLGLFFHWNFTEEVLLMKTMGRERRRVKCINWGVIRSALTLQIRFSCLAAVGQILLIMLSCTKRTAHLTKWIWPIYSRLGATWKLRKRETCPQSRPQWALVATGTRSYVCTTFAAPPNSNLRRRKKLCFLSEPISKALSSYSKPWFHWLHKLLGSLLKKIKQMTDS